MKSTFVEELTLRDTMKPVAISCCNLKTSAPLVFSPRRRGEPELQQRPAQRGPRLVASSPSGDGLAQREGQQWCVGARAVRGVVEAWWSRPDGVESSGGARIKIYLQRINYNYYKNIFSYFSFVPISFGSESEERLEGSRDL